MNTDFVKRLVVVIDAKDAKVEVIHPQLAVLMVVNKANVGVRYLDVGALCYRRRGRPSPRQIGCPIDLSSLDHARIPVVQAVIEHLRANGNGVTADGNFQNINKFIDWIDAQKQPCAFDDLTAMKKAYGDYTQHLLHRMNISGINGQPIKQRTASSYQSGARKVVMLATDLSEPEAKGLATNIPQKGHQASHVNLKLPDADTQARTFAVLTKFIDEAHRLLVKNGTFPLRLDSPSGDSIYLYSDQVSTEKSKSANFSLLPFLANSPAFPTWAEVKSHFNFVEDSASTKVQNVTYGKARKKYNHNNKDMRSHLRQRIGAHAVTAGMLAFIAATSCNLSVTQNLEVDTLEIVPTSQGNRLSGAKGRANGKIVYPEFGARFSPIFTKYLELRNWVLNGNESVLVFPLLSEQYGFVSIGNNQIKALKNILTKALPNTCWVTPTQWRKNVSYQYVRLSNGDMALTAEKLGNTEATLRQSYSRPALEDFAAEMTVFFESMYQAAIDRTRSVERIPVRITDDKKPEMVTGIGMCGKATEANPKRALGFTAQAPAPACGDPETCLFCEFYAVHADEQDIRRLLSLRYLIQAIKYKQPVDHWQNKFGPSLHRIDEVLSAMRDADGSIEKTITYVSDEVESGALDPFWAIHFDTLVTVGAVS
jgi:hypothetical protein